MTTPQNEGAPNSYETDKLGKYFDFVFPELKAQFVQAETLLRVGPMDGSQNSPEAKVCRAINNDIPEACEFGFPGTPEDIRLSRLISALGRVSSLEAAKATRWRC